MIIFDPLYGRFRIPDYLSRLVLTPEVRRLSQVRFLNTMTPSLATLGELRRYSHTLGVLFLCDQLTEGDYSQDELKALAASVLLHDIGTPPFGHLFEYHLKDSKDWSHERVIESVLWGKHAPENSAHQLFATRPIQFRSALRKEGISTDLVQAIVTRKHPLSQLLFGTIDLDNLDNIARMGWSLGLSGGAECARRLSSALSVDRSSHLCLPIFERDTVLRWASLRRRIYEILVFDAPTVAAQAVLSEAIATAFRQGNITEEDWYFTDEELLARLQETPDTKDAIAREYLGQLPEMVCLIQIHGSLKDMGFNVRSDAKEFLETVLRAELEDDNVLGYVFVDHGTFSKTLTFLDPKSSIVWSDGETSSSVVLYGFVRVHRHPPASRLKRVLERLMERFMGTQRQVARCEIAPFAETADAQCSLDFATRQN